MGCGDEEEGVAHLPAALYPGTFGAVYRNAGLGTRVKEAALRTDVDPAARFTGLYTFREGTLCPAPYTTGIGDCLLMFC